MSDKKILTARARSIRLASGLLLSLLLASCGTRSAANSPTSSTSSATISSATPGPKLTSASTIPGGGSVSIDAAKAALESNQAVYPAPIGNTPFKCPNPTGVSAADSSPTGQVRNSLLLTTRAWLEAGSVATRLSLSDRALWPQVLLGPSQNPVMSQSAANQVQLQVSRPTSENLYSGCFATIVSDSVLVTVCNPASASIAACDPGVSLELYELNRSGHWLVWQELA